MLLRALSKCLLNTDRSGALTTSLGKPVQGFDHPFGEEMLLMSSVNLPGTALDRFHASYPWIPGRRDRHLPLHFPSSRSCREQWGHPFRADSGWSRKTAPKSNQVQRCIFSLVSEDGFGSWKVHTHFREDTSPWSIFKHAYTQMDFHTKLQNVFYVFILGCDFSTRVFSRSDSWFLNTQRLLAARYVLSTHTSSDDKLTLTVSLALELPMTRVPSTKIICSLKLHSAQNI